MRAVPAGSGEKVTEGLGASPGCREILSTSSTSSRSGILPGMGTPLISRSLQASFRQAIADAKSMRHQSVTLEHLLLALLREARTQELLVACGANVQRLRKRLETFLAETIDRFQDGVSAEPQVTLGIERVLQRAAIHALSSEKKLIEEGDFLVALFREQESHALFLLQQEGTTRLALLGQLAPTGPEQGVPFLVQGEVSREVWNALARYRGEQEVELGREYSMGEALNALLGKALGLPPPPTYALGSPPGQGSSGMDPPVRIRREDVPGELPIYPLRNAVFVPGGVLPLAPGRRSTRALVQDAAREDLLIGVVTQRSLEVEEPGFPDLYRMGTVARVVKALKRGEEVSTIVIQGLVRFRMLEAIQERPYIKARVEVEEPPSELDAEDEAMARALRTLASEIITLTPDLPAAALPPVESITSPAEVPDLLVAHLEIPLEQKQAVLDTVDLKTRQRLVRDLLTSHRDLLLSARKS